MRTIRTGHLDKLDLRLVETKGSYVGLIFDSKGEKSRITGNAADEVWQRLHAEAARANPKFVGYDGARSRFLHFFPDGFRSPAYATEERDYKVAAKHKLEQIAPLAEAMHGGGFGRAILSVYQATNLLSPFEKARLSEVLKQPAGDQFVRAAAQLAFGEIKPALFDMERVLKPFDCAKWTVATYLPFLWRPEAHMFLKPEVTKDFAARIGHRFASFYEAQLDADIYDSLLDLADETSREIAGMQPRDRIDVQSFIWVVGEYRD